MVNVINKINPDRCPIYNSPFNNTKKKKKMPTTRILNICLTCFLYKHVIDGVLKSFGAESIKKKNVVIGPK